MPLSITNLSTLLGAEATGVDLTSNISAVDKSALNRAFSERAVLVVRDQKLNPQQMHDAVQIFGDIFEQHNKRFALPECPQIHYISNQDRFPDGSRYIPGAGYHTDHSNDPKPPKATVLHAVKLPDHGGDTQFVDMRAAYDDLDDGLKSEIENLQAEHVYQASHSTRKLMTVKGSNASVQDKSVFHPLVRKHPETGRKALYLNPIRIENLAGIAQPDALKLLGQLLTHATQEKYQYRHKWRPGGPCLLGQPLPAPQSQRRLRSRSGALPLSRDAKRRGPKIGTRQNLCRVWRLTENLTGNKHHRWPDSIAR